VILAKGRWERNHRGLASLSRLPLPVKPVFKSGNSQFPVARFFGVIRHDFLHLQSVQPSGWSAYVHRFLVICPKKTGKCPVDSGFLLHGVFRPPIGPDIMQQITSGYSGLIPKFRQCPDRVVRSPDF